MSGQAGMGARQGHRHPGPHAGWMPWSKTSVNCRSGRASRKLGCGGVGSLSWADYITPLRYPQPKNVLEKQEKGMKDKLPEISKEKQKLVSRIKRLAGQIDAVQ